MKLLFDHNLSPCLVSRLANLYSDSNHLFNLNLDTAEVSFVWEYAKDNDFTIVTKDFDFSELSLLRGFLPKVIWIRISNCTTNDLESSIRSHTKQIDNFYRELNLGILILYLVQSHYFLNSINAIATSKINNK